MSSKAAEEVKAYENLQAVTRHCLCIDPAKRAVSIQVAKSLFSVAVNAGWV